MHEKSYSKNIIHVHGNIKKGVCLKCGKIYKKLDFNNYICRCNGLIRPNIVFYEEDIKYFNKCINILRKTDLLIILGTSLTVEPVASFPTYVKATTPIIIINNSPTYMDDDRMTVVFKEDIADTLENIFKYLDM